MAENEATAKIAELISADIFPNFRWKLIGGKNLNWDCVKLKEHNKEKVKTHPADVVFVYEDPYTKKSIYMHTDLKSYGRKTISSTDFSSTLKSLSQQIECAEISSSWKANYLKGNSNYIIHGLLFVYNHDSDAELSLIQKFSSENMAQIPIPTNKQIFVLDPLDIGWITDISNCITSLLHKRQLSEDYCFFYPQKTFKGVSSFTDCATIELLKSNVVIVKSSKSSRCQNLKVFYRGCGETTEEFKYLLDYFRHNQFLEYPEDDSIEIFFSKHVKNNAANLFSRAQADYLEQYAKNQKNLTAAINNIRITSLQHIDNSNSFNQNIIGMSI